MRLSRIEIENFKGIGERQVIDLAPITLLFGPNSAGKSTILQALHYVREILDRQNLDPDKTVGGGLTDLGGFRALVHQHDIERSIRIKVVIALHEPGGHEDLPLNNGGSLEDEKFQMLPIRYRLGKSMEFEDSGIVESVGVEFEIRWNAMEKVPHLQTVSIEMDGRPLCSVETPQPHIGESRLTKFNLSTHFLRRSSTL
jgi:AAA ATPase domain